MREVAARPHGPPGRSATRRAPRQAVRSWVAFVVLAVVVPATPTVVRLVEAANAFAPASHPRWLGDRYLVSAEDGVWVVPDASGVGSVVATLAAWSGRAVPEASTPPGDRSPSVEAELAVALSGLGLDGAWGRPGAARIEELAVPFVALVAADGHAVPVVVRRVVAGHVYAFDPRVGSVMYRPVDWTRAWSGRAFVFDVAPPAPGAWR